MSQQWRLRLGLLSALGCIVSIGYVFLAIARHSDSFVITGFPWWLHLGIFPLSFLFILTFNRDKQSGKWKGVGLSQLWLGIAVLLIAIAHYLANFSVAANARDAEFVDGSYVIYEHGRIVRESSAAEYREQRYLTSRLWAGSWALFYCFPTLYFLFSIKVADEDDSRRLVAVPGKH